MGEPKFGIVDAAVLYVADQSGCVGFQESDLCGETIQIQEVLPQARALGLKRAQSAPVSTCLALLVCSTLLSAHPPGPVVLAVCSATGPALSVQKLLDEADHEKVGFLDPFLLQNTLPSFAGSALFNALKLQGQALGFNGTKDGFASAYRLCTSSLMVDRAQKAIIVVSEYGGDLKEGSVADGFAVAFLIEEIGPAARAPRIVQDAQIFISSIFPGVNFSTLAG